MGGRPNSPESRILLGGTGVAEAAMDQPMLVQAFHICSWEDRERRRTRGESCEGRGGQLSQEDLQ